MTDTEKSARYGALVPLLRELVRVRADAHTPARLVYNGDIFMEDEDYAFYNKAANLTTKIKSIIEEPEKCSD